SSFLKIRQHRRSTLFPYTTLFRSEVYTPITVKEENYRARRITDYLNLMQRIVTSKMEKLKNSAFETGSDIVKYFEMLPDSSMLKDRKSTRLNSSHVKISYAVFCLK